MGQTHFERPIVHPGSWDRYPNPCSKLLGRHKGTWISVKVALRFGLGKQQGSACGGLSEDGPEALVEETHTDVQVRERDRHIVG